MNDDDWFLKSQLAKAEAYNATAGDLNTYDGIDCPLCLNRGYIMHVDEEGNTTLSRCKCIAQRKSIRFMERSGLSQVLDTYTWEKWQEKETWQSGLRKIAQEYAAEPQGWFMAAGRPGTGKTHICTAICGDLLKRGLEVRYLLWRDFTTQAKAVVNDAEAYQALMEPYKRVRVLYLDDLLKAGKGQGPTAADCNLAFELINARYANPKTQTIISSELTIERIIDLDEAIGSRIYERSKGHYADLSKRKNWRLG